MYEEKSNINFLFIKLVIFLNDRNNEYMDVKGIVLIICGIFIL